MRKILFAIGGFLICQSAVAQLRMISNPQATNFYNKAMATARPAVQSAINKNARQLSGKDISEEAVRTQLKNDPAFSGMSGAGMDAIMIMVFIQVNNDAEKNICVRK